MPPEIDETTVYPYVCGEQGCLTLWGLTMPEITAHWHSHRENGPEAPAPEETV